MERGNVLVIGNSGVGKSTLINAVLGDEIAKTGWGTSGTTDKLTIYESTKIPFRIIDTIGFEPSYFKRSAAVRAVRRWSAQSAKKGNADTQINVIWFCVDGTSSKLFPQAIKDLISATSMWKSVPVIVAITKSYSVPERARNIEMVTAPFQKQTRTAENLRSVIPVVASTYVLNDTAFATPEGITELIDETNALMPEGIQAGALDISMFNLTRKRALAHGLVGVSTAAGVVVGAVPIPIADALILSPIETAEINALSRIYDIPRNEQSKQFFSSIVEVGTVSVAAKAAISALKAIPGVHLGTSILNALIAGSIIAILGEGSIYAFEQVYLGKKTLSDVDWVRKLMESKFSSPFIAAVTAAAQRLTDGADKQLIVKTIADLVTGKFDSVDKAPS